MLSLNHLVLGMYLDSVTGFILTFPNRTNSKDGNNFICSSSFSERQRKWKEELVQELERKRGKYPFIY